MDQSSVAHDVGVAAVKFTPIGLIYMGNTVWGPQEWSYVGIGIYAVLQSAHLLWKWRREARQK